MGKPHEKEYIHYYKLAREHISDPALLPDLSDDEIVKDISNEDWLMMMRASVDERKDAVNQPEPNTYLVVADDSLTLGLTFNNVDAVDKLKNILHKNSSDLKERLVKKLLALNDSYQTVVYRKTRKIYGPAPSYETVTSTQTNKLNEEEFEKIIHTCNKIRAEGRANRKGKGRSYFEVPSADLLVINVPKTDKAFLDVIDDMAAIFKECVSVKSDNKIEEEELLEKLTKIDSWKWYLEEDRKGLSELLKERFDYDITPSKLRTYMYLIGD